MTRVDNDGKCLEDSSVSSGQDSGVEDGVEVPNPAMLLDAVEEEERDQEVNKSSDDELGGDDNEQTNKV